PQLAGPPLPASEEPWRAVAVPMPSEDGDLALSYRTIVFGKLELAKQFPEEARARHARGSSVITFALDDKGQVLSVELVQPSGDAALDAESIAMVRRAAPFPPPPPGAQKEFGAQIDFDPAK
ncbi:MAG: TonB family protein, partial [Methylovirgula sp.]